MAHLFDLMDSVYEAKDQLSQAENDRDAFLEPILAILGATGDYISHCSREREILHITRSGSIRGCAWDDNYTFPLDIFNSNDPIKAASEYVAAQDQAKKSAEHKAKLDKIKRLQIELENE